VRILAIVSLVSFAGVGTFVGARLLLCALGHPFCAVGRLPGLFGTALGDGLFALGLGICASGIALLYTFTWRVFRPRAPWARVGVAVASLFVLALAGGLLHASGQADTLPEVLPLTRPFAVGFTLAVGFAFLWTGVEAWTHAQRLHRRLALGLVEPVVLDRVRLWGTAGIAGAVLCATIAGCLAAGMMVLHEPFPLALTALAGIVASTCWTLAFVPPARYLRRVEQRAGPALRTA
jgi:hypothetical protein